MPNQIVAIAPYWLEELGAWVFDDPKVELSQGDCTMLYVMRGFALTQRQPSSS
jgi:hypothetical protein